MKTLLWLLILTAASLAATTLLPRHVPAHVRPDLYLVLLIFLIARAEAAEVISFGWMTGLAKDVLSVGPTGQYALIYLVFAGLLLIVRAYFNTRAAFVFMPLACAAALAADITSAAIAYFSVGAPPTTGVELLSAALVTASVTPLGVAALDVLGVSMRFARARLPGMEGGFQRV